MSFYLLILVFASTVFQQDAEDGPYSGMPTEALLAELEQTVDKARRLDVMLALIRRTYELPYERREALCHEAMKIEFNDFDGYSRRATIQIALAVCSIQKGEPEKAEQLLRKALANAKKFRDPKREFLARNNLAIVLGRLGAPAEEIESQYRWLLGHFAHAEQENTVAVLHNYGCFLQNHQRELESLLYFERAQAGAIQSENFDAAIISTIAIQPGCVWATN